jgi:hypothetical protein
MTCMRQLQEAATNKTDNRLVAYKNVLKRFHPAFRHFVSLL